MTSTRSYQTCPTASICGESDLLDRARREARREAERRVAVVGRPKATMMPTEPQEA